MGSPLAGTAATVITFDNVLTIPDSKRYKLWGKVLVSLKREHGKRLGFFETTSRICQWKLNAMERERTHWVPPILGEDNGPENRHMIFLSKTQPRSLT